LHLLVDSTRRFNVFTCSDPVNALGQWGQEVMPDNMEAKDVNAVNGELLIVPAKRTNDGKAVYVALQSITQSPEHRGVGFYYKENVMPKAELKILKKKLKNFRY
jgi:sialidase-1